MAAKWSVPGYEEVRELGAGATGRVVLARHVGSGRPVAIKYLARDLVREPGFLDRFRREAETLARLRDPHIIRLYDYVENREGAAIVMEPVEGPSLRRLLAANGPCPPEVALTVLHGSLLGLAAAHSYGVVHRDYKPENVLVDAAGDSKLADFGVAAPAGRNVPGHGTPAYMAPEQWNGMRATPATDMYAATVVFFEMLTGERPYVSDTMAGLRRAHESAPVPLERAPEAVRPLLALGLSKSPDHRYQDVPSFLAHLERVAVAGYGTDWRERGTRDLAVAASLLIAAFPLLALGGAGGGGAVAGGGGGGGGASAGASGSAGAPSASSGYVAAHAGNRAGNRLGRSLTHLGSATAKVKAIAAALALAAVATTTTVVVANIAPTGHSAPPQAGGPSKGIVASSPSDTSGLPLVPPGSVTTSSSDTGASTSSDIGTAVSSGSPASQPDLPGSSSVSGASSSAAGTSGSSSASSSSSQPPPPPSSTTVVTPPTSTSTSSSSTPTPTPTPAPVTITVTASADHPSTVTSNAVCQAGKVLESFTGKISASGATTVSYYWQRSDGSQTQPTNVTLSAASPASVADRFATSGSGWDQLLVTGGGSSRAVYVVNCLSATLTTQDVTAVGCATTAGRVYFNASVTGNPGSTIRYYYLVTFAVGTPTSSQGPWTNLTLNGQPQFYGYSDQSNTITGSLWADPMDGGAPFQLGLAATGHLTCL